MAASMNFYPGGAEDESSDEDGFVLGCDDNYAEDAFQEEPMKSINNTQNIFHGKTNHSSRGGFGIPPSNGKIGQKPQQTDQRKKTSTQNRPVGMDDFRMAILKRNAEVVKSYISQGCDVNTVLKGGWTALMYAASSAHPDILQLLLEHGADPRCHNDMYTSLMAACASTTNRAEDVMTCVSVLIDKGVDVNSHDRYHMSPLIYAAREGREDVVEKLLYHGANINKQDSRGWTSLSWAVSKNHIKVVKLLLSKGANSKMKHSDGQTVMDVAVTQDLSEIITLLGGGSGDAQTQQSLSDIQENYTQLSPKYTSNNDINSEYSSESQFVLKYGELELFLCGLDLGSFVSVFQKQHVDFATFLRMTDDDLIKMGIHQIGVRKKILDGIQDVHKKEWEKSSLNSVHYNKTLRCADTVAMVANISKHCKYIGSTVGYIRDQIRASPHILDVQDGTSPEQLHENVQDTINNVQSLQDELGRLNTHLCKLLKAKNFDPPDLIQPKKTRKSRLNVKRLFIVGVCVGTISVVIWKRQTIQESLSTLLLQQT